MKVILLEDVKKQGKKGDVVSVSDGYARNYLLPRGLAEQASGGNLKELKQEKERQKARQQQERERAEQLKAKLADTVVTLAAKAGDNGKLFGSVTSKEIASVLQKEYGIKMDKRKIDLPDAIKSLGEHTVRVKIHPEVHGQLTVKVTAQ